MRYSYVASMETRCLKMLLNFVTAVFDIITNCLSHNFVYISICLKTTLMVCNSLEKLNLLGDNKL